MAAPSTALEALTAELLGDVGRLHDDVKAMAAALPGAAQAIRTSGKEAADSISTALESAVADLTHEAAQREAAIASQAVNEEVAQARATAAKLIEEVARANRNVNASKWFTVAAGACIAVAAVAGGAGYWIASTQAESAAARAGQVLAGPEGAAAVKLAELGQARILLECKGPGWTEKDGSCYGTPAAPGKTVGWRTK